MTREVKWLYSEKDNEKKRRSALTRNLLKDRNGHQPLAVFERCVRDEDARSYPEIIPGRIGFLDPLIEVGLLFRKKRRTLMEGTSVADIHRYPLQPEGYEEPLFPTPASRREVMEHLLEAPWLCRASDLKGHTGEVAHIREEPVEIESSRGQVKVLRLTSSRRCAWKSRRVVEILDRWREVRRWWDEAEHTDRLLFRVLLSRGEVMDLVRERSGGWALVGVAD